eukprot:TRINITY_DN3687_c0_g1_i3.p1 TRINITY_DN3687_c0_g1~~TRINITY_DN3687_c0_g1_i3.p1  ORF type:complete len:507 (+),score=130.73 TRINITY_DN3687_c0_g1_i3:92-1612(+)
MSIRINCVTCYELISVNDDTVALPCGHLFHYQCTLQWFQTKKNCPSCRQTANERTARKIYFAEADEPDSQKSSEDLQHQIDELQLQLRLTKIDLENLKKSKQETEDNNKKVKDELKVADKARRDAEGKMKDYKYQIKHWMQEREDLNQKVLDFDNMKKKLAKFTLVEKALEGSIGDVNAVLHERGCFSNDSKDLATLVVELKKKLGETKKSKAILDRKLDQLSLIKEEDRKKIMNLSIQVSELKARQEGSEEEIKFLESLKRDLEEENDGLKTKVIKLEQKLKRKEDLSSRIVQSTTFSVGKENGDQNTAEDDEDDNDSSYELLKMNEEEFSFMESPKVAFKSCAIAAGEKRKALSQLGSSQQPHRQEDAIQGSSSDYGGAAKKIKNSTFITGNGSNNTAAKVPVGVNIAGRGTSSVAIGKKLKYGNLLEIGTLSYDDGKGYNGFGGRSRPDNFPEPSRRPQGAGAGLMKRSAFNKKVSTSANKKFSKIEKNQMTVDKFFGSFDTP